MPAFADLAAAPDPPLDGLALALAAEFRRVDEIAARASLNAFGGDLYEVLEGVPATPPAQAAACAEVLGRRYRFKGDTEDYDDPGNSMLDLVLERRRGLPILLSVVYVEVARRAGVPLQGVGLPGHFVVGHFGATPPLLLDPFNRGTFVDTDAEPELVRPWGPHEIAMRILNNLVAAYQRRGDLANALHAAAMRLKLPPGLQPQADLHRELRALQSRLN